MINNAFVKLKPNSYLLSYSFCNFRTAVLINKSALDILKLCDGTNAVDEIIQILMKEYKESKEKVKAFVCDFLKRFENKIISYNTQKSSFPQSQIRGSSDIYFPDSLSWEITNYCPLNCRHCYLEEKNLKNLSKEQINQILELIDKSGIYNIEITGGDPLTHPDFEYIISELIKRKLSITVLTSGIHYNDKILNVLEKLKEVSGSIRVSIDGLKETHNYIRNNPRAYKKSMDFIDEVIKRGVPCAVATCLINQDDYEISKLVELLKNKGIFSYALGLVSVQGQAEKNIIKPKYDLNGMNELLIRLNKNYASGSFKVRVPHESCDKNCGGGYNLVRIRPNLDITACPMMDLKLGNLNYETFDKIMLESGLIFSQLNTPSHDTCKDCKLNNYCGSCSSMALINKNKVKKCYWYEDQKDLINKLLSKNI